MHACTWHKGSYTCDCFCLCGRVIYSRFGTRKCNFTLTTYIVACNVKFCCITLTIYITACIVKFSCLKQFTIELTYSCKSLTFVCGTIKSVHKIEHALKSVLPLNNGQKSVVKFNCRIWAILLPQPPIFGRNI